MTAQTDDLGTGNHAMEKLYREEFRVFNEIGDRLGERSFQGKTPLSNLAVVLVIHSMFSGLPLIDAAERITGRHNTYLVCKPSSRNRDFERYPTHRGNAILSSGKEDFMENPEKVIHEFSSIGRPVLFLDHGGYGAYHIEALWEKAPIAGILEYTLNGHQRYQRAHVTEHIDYASIAESRTKRFADYSCGRFIGEICSFVVQQFSGFGGHLRSIKQVGIIGFGRLGSHAADQMKNNGAHNIMVYDIDPEKMIAAQQKGYNIQATCVEDIVQWCNVILVGCDTAPIKPHMYAMMHEHTIIATVTSPDDALDIRKLADGGHLVREIGFPEEGIPMTTYRAGTAKHVHLICDGDAPNLKYSRFGADDPSLAMPLVLHALAGYEMARNHGISTERIEQLERGIMEDYLHICQQVAGEMERYWHGQPE
ncbi:MAG: S-adenosyl-L-homocysteine hydrolase, NAD binding domain [Candidatus Kentron sp. G]|nr:MAG: S-adenosyl-L-homocysteine hydrolase, NAD binding domain [Candidatus Kentron sp. G]VFN02117.1 MAG: S-adenosyl-L-homocysteine hydrolase, NAD binding domain [Candidatus Kentron sp. G]VFN03007.1 MAG: S-adenosyl-L-homocysteine hydrolase, NAD binding domain [Candidatus Kentron sp. G]